MWVIANPAGTNRSIFGFRVSKSIQHDARSLLAVVTVSRSRSRDFAVAPLAVGLIWHQVRRSIYSKESGRVTLVLTATDYPRKGMHWIEMDDNFSLQNLLVDLFGKLGMPRS